MLGIVGTFLLSRLACVDGRFVVYARPFVAREVYADRARMKEAMVELQEAMHIGAVALQCTYRSWKQHGRYQKMRAAAIRIQNVVRQRLARKELQSRRTAAHIAVCNKAATQIQATARARQGRKKFARQRAAAVVMQCAVRVMIAKAKVYHLTRFKRAKIEYDAQVKLAAHGRGLVARRR